MPPKLMFRITKSPFGMGIELRFGQLFDDGSFHIAMPVTMFAVKKGEMAPQEPMMTFSDFDGSGQAAMQSLMDELWQNGCRPKDIGTAGHLAATQAHLQDMRAIVSKQTGTPLP